MNKAELSLTSDHQLLVTGKLAFDTVNRLWEESQSLLQQVSMIEVNLEKVEQSDSAGLALLIEWYRYAKEHDQKIIFKNVPAQLLNIARISRLDQILQLSSE